MGRKEGARPPTALGGYEGGMFFRGEMMGESIILCIFANYRKLKPTQAKETLVFTLTNTVGLWDYSILLARRR